MGRPTLTPRQAKELGYAGLVDGHALFFGAVEGILGGMARYSEDDGYPVGADEIGTRKGIEAVMDLESLYRIEAATILAGDKPI